MECCECGNSIDDEELSADMGYVDSDGYHCAFCNSDEDLTCEHCGSTENVGKDPYGELLCPDCCDDIWFT